VKARALAVVLITFSVSIVLVDAWPVRVVLLVTAAILLAFLARIPSRA
jgi:uncharacterized membrane protein YbaN (DUF454 family)